MRRYQQGARQLSIPEFKPNFPAISFRYVAFSADGARFVSNSSGLPISTNARTPDQRVVDWTVRDATSGEQVASLGFPEGEGLRPSLSADGSRLAISVQTPNDKTNVKYEHLIIVVETATGRRLVDGRRLENSPDVLVFSPDGRKLAGVIAPHDVDARPALRRPLHAWAAVVLLSERRFTSGTRRPGGKFADCRHPGPAGFLAQDLGRDGPVAPIAYQKIDGARRGDSERRIPGMERARRPPRLSSASSACSLPAQGKTHLWN
jgi:hypothetical protein